MNAITKWKIATISLCAISITTSAQRYRHYRAYVPVRTYHTTVITRPPVCYDVRVSNRLTKKDRYTMAIAYMKNNGYMSSRQYANITGLKKSVAEAELDAFSTERGKKIKTVTIDGKKRYTLRFT
ncbi:hypothetical protein [uncultured Prevotella sp.]|uniref:hypothetical protein n=1 Tax=uncultured Prevotella sp. TaxID=159272 RepID=UPI00261C60EE|nr:hypothetical protein [uncultured Prevotella sp.]